MRKRPQIASRGLSAALVVVALAWWHVPGRTQTPTAPRASSGDSTAAGALEDSIAATEAAAADTASAQDVASAVVVAAPDTTSVPSDSLVVMDAHPQDSPENRGLLIVSGDGKTSLRVRGSVRLAGAYDFNGLQNAETFDTFEIPTGSGNKVEPRFFMSANQTRLGLEALRETSRGDLAMRIEADFLGDPNNMRLRHAYGRLRNFTVGQTWSTFGDVHAVPRTVDLDGPNSSVQVRTVLVRYGRQRSDGTLWAVAAESPEPEVAEPDSIGLEPAFQNAPDVVARIRTPRSWGHLSVAGVLRTIAVRDPINRDVDYSVGGGVLVGGRVQVARSSQFLWQIVAGEGISRFITALSGKNLDVVFDPATQKWQTLATGGGYVTYGHDWSQRFESYFTVGSVIIQNKGFQSASAFSHSAYVSGNVFWNITAGTSSGLEYSWGARVDKGGDDGTANRFSFIFYYDF